MRNFQIYNDDIELYNLYVRYQRGVRQSTKEPNPSSCCFVGRNFHAKEHLGALLLILNFVRSLKPKVQREIPSEEFSEKTVLSRLRQDLLPHILCRKAWTFFVSIKLYLSLIRELHQPMQKS